MTSLLRWVVCLWGYVFIFTQQVRLWFFTADYVCCRLSLSSENWGGGGESSLIKKTWYWTTLIPSDSINDHFSTKDVDDTYFWRGSIQPSLRHFLFKISWLYIVDNVYLLWINIVSNSEGAYALFHQHHRWWQDVKIQVKYFIFRSLQISPCCRWPQ